MPDLDFINLVSRKDLFENDIVVTASKQGVGSSSGTDVLLEDLIYKGTENNVTKNSRITGSFFCSFEDLTLYPFDTETCTMDLKVVGNAYQFTKLIPKRIHTGYLHYLPNFILKEEPTFLEKPYEKGEMGIQVEIKLSRKLTSIFMVTYVPTILINIFNQATNYFEGTIFSGDIIKVNLTSMMVLSALYISTSNNLPDTASIKYVEIWLLLSFIYPFFIVLTHTYIQKIKTCATPCLIASVV